MSLKLLFIMFSDCEVHRWICTAGDLDCGIVCFAHTIGVKRSIKLGLPLQPALNLFPKKGCWWEGDLVRRELRKVKELP